MSQPDDDRPFFSIVIPTFNRAHMIERAIGSCLAQTFARFEVVVVDDGSSDDTGQVVGRIGDPRVVYVVQENAGGGAARNAGAARAQGRYLAFLDSDDEFLPGKLEAFHRAIVAASEGNDRTVWYSPLWFQRGEGNRIRKPARAIGPEEKVGDYLFADEGLMQTSTLVIPRDLFAKVGFDARLRRFQDLDLCLRLEAAGARFSMLPDPHVIWHDEAPQGRVSYGTTARNLQEWVASQRSRLSERAYRGFLARYLVPTLVRAEPARAVRVLATALRHGSISAPRALSLLMRGAMPGAYGRFRDALVARRGA